MRRNSRQKIPNATFAFRVDGKSLAEQAVESWHYLVLEGMAGGDQGRNNYRSDGCWMKGCGNIPGIVSIDVIVRMDSGRISGRR